MKPIGIEHVTLTVPNIEEATHFFQKAFSSTILVDDLRPPYAPVAGPSAEAVFGMPKGAYWNHRRVLSLGSSYIELFEYNGTPQQRSPHTYDYGITHFAVHVNNLAEAANAIISAGGKVYPTYDLQTGLPTTNYDMSGWVYAETPWGSVIELVTFTSL